ncbi:MAG TPA: GNAT family protein [Streptosporangiaceae bacterium]|nr:GNAT family protein [Streptosporangiaceae bacterium]
MTNASATDQCTMPLPPPSVTLGPVTDPDYELISRWTESKSWVYAGGSRQYLNADAVRRLVESGRDNFLMVRDRDGRSIGAVSWHTGQYAASFEIGTMIGDTARWQIGFGLEAVFALMGLLFDTKHAHRVEFICGVFNKPAIQACCSGLIQIEGILRDYYYFDGTYHDAIIGSILREEYYALTGPGRTVSQAEIDESRHILDDYLAKNPVVLRKL